VIPTCVVLLLICYNSQQLCSSVSVSVRATTAEENSTDCGLTGTDVSLCVCVRRTAVSVCVCVFLGMDCGDTSPRGRGKGTHARTYARRRGGNNSRVIVLVPMLADKTSNVQRRVRAGAAATDENIIMCIEIG